jgi:hypothetical protein
MADSWLVPRFAEGRRGDAGPRLEKSLNAGAAWRGQGVLWGTTFPSRLAISVISETARARVPPWTETWAPGPRAPERTRRAVREGLPRT